ncbi:DUF2513 domain-containing protein [Ruegeria sp. ANG-R]|uniref:DUF2513 domain-containing protein n=1 Tax=Ruegeria sp. ANG-R TaxID=1577903 RepID=UPI00187C78C7|nr:DUF2513 domain-containing protein [Ruegeria sp. ANG-R]
MQFNYEHWRRHGIVGHLFHLRIADMQNDIELTRKILIAIREKDNLRPAPIQVPGYEPVLVMRHVIRLHDDGMIEGTVSEALGMEAPLVFVSDMTTAGHNFLAAIEQQDIWNRLNSTLNPAELAAFSLREIAGLAKELALAAAKKKLGLSE